MHDFEHEFEHTLVHTSIRHDEVGQAVPVVHDFVTEQMPLSGTQVKIGVQELVVEH